MNLTTTPMEPLQLLLFDKDPLTNSALEALLGDDERIDIAGNALSEEEALRLLEERRIDVVLMDVNVNNKTFERPLQQLKKKFPRQRVITLLYEENDAIEQLLENGADGYFLKERDMGDLANAIVSVHQEGYFRPAALDAEEPEPEGVLSYQRRQEG